MISPCRNWSNDFKPLQRLCTCSIQQTLKYSWMSLMVPWKQAYFWLSAYSPVATSVINNHVCNISALIMKNLAEEPVLWRTGFNLSKLSCSLAMSDQVSALLSALLIKNPPQAPWHYQPFERRVHRGMWLALRFSDGCIHVDLEMVFCFFLKTENLHSFRTNVITWLFCFGKRRLSK